MAERRLLGAGMVASLLGAIHVEVRAIGVGDHLRVEALLRRRRRWPYPELRAALAALLGKSADECAAVRALCDVRFGVAGDEEAARAEVVLSPDRTRVRRLVRRGAALVGVGLLLVLLRPPAPQTIAPKPAAVVAGGPEAPAEKDPDKYWSFAPLPVPPDARPLPTREVRPLDRVDGMAFLAGALLLVVALRLALVPRWSRRRRQALLDAEYQRRLQQRREHDGQLLPERVAAEEAHERSGKPLGVHYQVPLRAAVSAETLATSTTTLARLRAEGDSDQLDVPATIDATIEAGGRGVVRFAPGAGRRELVVLVHREAGDHVWLGGFERILDAWERDGVPLHRFVFANRPDDLEAWPHREPTSFDALARRYGGLTLLLFSRRLEVEQRRGGALEFAPWLARLDAFPLRIWVDPDPVPDGAEAAQIAEVLLSHGLRRFGLDDPQLASLARYVAADGIGEHPPPVRALPDLDDPAVERAVRTWATLCALVPDSRWDQIEEIRQRFPEVSTVLAERRDVALLLAWIFRQPEQRAVRRDAHQSKLKIDSRLEDRLVRELRDAERGLPLSRRLEFRGRKLLLEQLGEVPPEGTMLRSLWALKRASHLLLLDGDRAAALLDGLRDSGMGPEVDRLLEAARAQRLVETGLVGEEVKRRVAVDEPPEPEPQVAPRGAEWPELWRGFGRAWTLAAGGAAGLLLGAVALGAFAVPRWTGRPALASVREVTVAPGEALAYRDVVVVTRSTLRPKMVRIKPGTFLMGSPEDEEGRSFDETQHTVTIARAFLLAETETTREQYSAVTGENPEGQPECGKDCPVTIVSWEDAARYCDKLSEKEGIPTADRCYVFKGGEVSMPRGLDCRGYRLPTEAEWEYAARAGLIGQRYGDTDDAREVCVFSNVADRAFAKLDAYRFLVATYGMLPCDDGHARLAPAKSFAPSRFSLYDMNGNVGEWVSDWYARDLGERPTIDPMGPDTGENRVIRGGSWNSLPQDARVAPRYRDEPSNRGGHVGFRVARSL